MFYPFSCRLLILLVFYLIEPQPGERAAFFSLGVLRWPLLRPLGTDTRAACSHVHGLLGSGASEFCSFTEIRGFGARAILML